MSEITRLRAAGMPLVEGLLLDLRVGLRRMRRRPGFTAVGVLVVALGIGVTTTVFSALHQILLEPLPYHEPERLYRMWQRDDTRGWRHSSLSEPNYIDLRDGTSTFAAIGAYTQASGVLTGAGDPVQLRLARASASLFELLGIQPFLGRGFTPEEDADGVEPQAVLLAHGFWQRHLGRDPEIVGRAVTIDGRRCTVVGVLPAGHDWLRSYDAYLPLNPDPDGHRGNNILWAYGRLGAGATIDQAQAELDALALRIAHAHPVNNTMTGVTLQRLDRHLVGGGTRSVLWVLMGAVGFVLLIACANLANMLLAQITGRRQEIALSSALGAGRGRIIGQILTESTLLTLLGGLAGTVLAVLGVSALKALDPGGIPRLQEVTVSSWVCAFALVLTVLVGILSGLVPALQAPSRNLSEALREGARSSGSRRRDRIRGTLVVLEMALSLALLVGAGLMIRSLVELRLVECGFATDRRLLFDVTLPEAPYRDRQQLADFLDRFVGRLGFLPTVAAVGAVSAAPLEGLDTDMGIYAQERPPGPDQSTPVASWRLVTPGYFRGLGLPLVRGRTFADLSLAEAASMIGEEDDRRVLNVIISERVAADLWPGQDPIGKRAVLWSEDDTLGEVIGVVADMRERGRESGPTRAVYLSYGLVLRNPLTFVVHTSSDPAVIVPAARSLLGEIDPDLPLSNVRTMDEVITGSEATRRFITVLLLMFAGVALAMACAGIYGVMSCSVVERFDELAIRVTLGARPAELVTLLVGQGMRRALLGAAIGLAAAAGLSRFVSSILFGTAAIDGLTYVLVTVVLIITALGAVSIPALRASRIDPAVTLRQQ